MYESITTVGERGQITLPKTIRDKEGLKKKDKVIVKLEDNKIIVKKMKTKWGSCNTEAKRIWLNLELAKKPVDCLEYIIAHELVHLLERSHNQRFVKLMDKFMPKWQFHRDELNRLPYSHVDWDY